MDKRAYLVGTVITRPAKKRIFFSENVNFSSQNILAPMECLRIAPVFWNIICDIYLSTYTVGTGTYVHGFDLYFDLRHNFCNIFFKPPKCPEFG